MLQRLTEILAAFDADPRMAEKAIRELLASDEKQFFGASLALLKSGADSPGRDWLAGLLAERDLLAGPLCDPSSCSREEAIAIAKLAARRQPQLDIKLARKIPELTPAAAERALAILGAVSDGSRIVSVLMPLMRQVNPRLKSKCALLIGRSIKRCDWVAGYLADPDPRIRANAVEALWGLDLPEASLVFRKAASDPHGRVAVNAMIGLYRLGDPAAIASLCEIGRRGDPKSRASAAWGMGEIGDTRFLAALAGMNREPEDTVGRNAARAIQKIEKASSHVKERGLLHLNITSAQTLGDGTRRLMTAIAASGRWDPILLAPTGFVISEGSKTVTSYRVQAIDSITPLLVGFVLCGGQDVSDEDLEAAKTAVLGCLEHKRVADCWAVARNLEQILPFTADGIVLKKALNGSADAFRNARSTDVLTTLAERATKLRGNRHLMLLGTPSGLPAGAFAAQQPPLEQILKPLLDANIAVHVIGLRVTSPAESLAAVCQKTGGIFVPAADRDQLAEAYQRLCSSVRNRYEILYRIDAPAADAQIRVEVYSEFGYGQAETSLH